jgi:hypothetical protein
MTSATATATAMPAAASNATASGADRRRRARLRSRVIGWLVGDHGADEAREILVRDVSRHGVGFETNWMLRLEQVIRVRIGLGPLRLAREARVVNIRRLGNGTFAVGAEFC